MAKPLDAIDEHIIQLLRGDGRMPTITLAEKIGLSRSATQERLARLERDGVVAGYTIRLCPPGTTGIQAWVMLRYAAGFSCKNVVPRILERREVRLIHSLAGEIDLLIRVEAESAENLLAFREHLMSLDGVADVVTAPVLTVHA